MTHRTASGKTFDMNQFKLSHETEIAVGNSRTNARGDQLGPGGNIVKTRDQIMTEFYQRQKGSKLSSGPVYNDSDFINDQIIAAPDIFETPEPEPVVIEEIPIEPVNAKLEAIAKSQALAERLKSQRKKD